MGYTVVEASIRQWREEAAAQTPLPSPLEGQFSDKNDLLPAYLLREQLSFLEHSSTLVLGPSGAGKSSLVNLLVPGAAAQTGEISQALNSGKHTTTRTQWYWLDKNQGSEKRSALIDSPGFQEFGLHHIAAPDLQALMPDVREHAGGCKFYNCTHLHEPGCAVLAAVQAQAVVANRHRIYADLFAELSSAPRY
jgi:ribosome biogenesis GTPase / thiamine phosphate phosphatase